jgi:hypothetical protein
MKNTLSFSTPHPPDHPMHFQSHAAPSQPFPAPSTCDALDHYLSERGSDDLRTPSGASVEFEPEVPTIPPTLRCPVFVPPRRRSSRPRSNVDDVARTPIRGVVANLSAREVLALSLLAASFMDEGPPRRKPKREPHGRAQSRTDARAALDAALVQLAHAWLESALGRASR